MYGPLGKTKTNTDTGRFAEDGDEFMGRQIKFVKEAIFWYERFQTLPELVEIQKRLEKQEAETELRNAVERLSRIAGESSCEGVLVDLLKELRDARWY